MRTPALSAEEQSGPGFTDAWVRAWWPIIVLVLGVVVIVVGGILFST